MSSELKERFQLVEICSIKPNPFQPRRFFSKEELEELAASIKSVGIIHPPLVKPLPDGKFELLAGERRLKASEMAGLKNIPVIIKESSSKHSAESALIENIQRVDLNPLDIAKALKSLQENFQLNQEQLAQRIGKKRSTIANYLRMLSLPSFIQQSIAEGTITMGHAKAILSLDEEKKKIVLYEKILEGKLTVRQAEEEAVKFKTQKKPSATKKIDPFIADLERKISEKFGTQVIIKNKGKAGKILIDYYNLDDLERILEKI